MNTDKQLRILERKVIQSNNQYKEMFRKSKFLLQQNSCLIAKMFKSKSKQLMLGSQRTPKKIPDTSQNYSKTTKRQKIESFKNILSMLKDMQSDESEYISEHSSKHQFNVQKYYKYEDETIQKENINSNPRQYKKNKQKNYLPLLMRMQIDIERRKIKQRQATKLNLLKQSKQIQQLEIIRKNKQDFIRQKSYRYLTKRNGDRSISANKNNTS